MRTVSEYALCWMNFTADQRPTPAIQTPGFRHQFRNEPDSPFGARVGKAAASAQGKKVRLAIGSPKNHQLYEAPFDSVPSFTLLLRRIRTG